MTAIRCNNLGKVYKNGKIKALEGLNLEVPEHAIFGFLGPNGAGKTTTIKILTGLMKASSGEAWVADELVNKNSLQLRAKIGYLPQEPKLYGWMSALELLDFVGKVFSMSKLERVKRTQELLELSDLTKAARRRISTFSGGMLQRLGIAQALMSKPKVIFLDEPTSSLDPIGRKEVLEVIGRLAIDSTVFLSTHILEDVERVCDTVAILNNGHLLVEEKTEILQQKYSSAIIEVEMETVSQAENLSEMCLNNSIIKYIKREDGVISFEGNMTEEGKRLLIRLIADHGFQLIRYESKKASLEDVFIKIIGKS